MSFADQLHASRVLPVITAFDVDSTLQLVRSLNRGGMDAVEITLRTDAALESVRAVKKALPHLQVAAGTVTTPDDMARAGDAGADFCISPGISEALLRASAEQGIPLLPGVATASEVMLGKAYGLHVFKLFPAVAIGGIDLLKALKGPFPEVQFCPTGGLTPDNFRDFLALSNVICCGGSWMVSKDLVKAGQWDRIEFLTREAMQ